MARFPASVEDMLANAAAFAAISRLTPAERHAFLGFTRDDDRAFELLQDAVNSTRPAAPAGSATDEKLATDSSRDRDVAQGRRLIAILRHQGRIGDREFEVLSDAIGPTRPAAAADGESQRIPTRYLPADWRDITPIDPDTADAGIGFTTDQGEVFLKLSIASLVELRDVIDVTINNHFHGTKSQSASDLGNERSDVRTPVEVLK